MHIHKMINNYFYSVSLCEGFDGLEMLRNIKCKEDVQTYKALAKYYEQVKFKFENEFNKRMVLTEKRIRHNGFFLGEIPMPTKSGWQIND